MSDRERPVITLVIPTRERAETLQYALSSAVKQASQSYEILVSDNDSGDHTRAVVEAFSDVRVRYANTGKRLSMSDNWEFALERARGRHVVFIGDDDAILPGAIDELEKLIQEKPHLAYMWDTPIYTWPIDSRDPRLERLPRVEPNRSLDLRRMARFVYSFGGWRYWKIPGVYHAAVSRAVLDAIRESTGRVFHTTQPDLFTSLAVPVFVETALYVGCPLTVHGRSAKATSGSSIAKEGGLALARYMGEFGEYRIHPTLYPEAPRYANLIVDAFLVAKDLFPQFYGSMKFNYTAMWAFLCRLRLQSAWDVLRNWRAISRYHPFSPMGFLGYLLLHGPTLLRYHLTTAAARRLPIARSMPRDIEAFSIELSSWLRQNQPRRAPGRHSRRRG